MRSLNKLMLIGNVGAEPEIRTTGTGKKVANFSIATSEKYNDRNGQSQEKTQWHRCVAWERTAEIIDEYVHKGDRLYIEGKVEYSQTEDEHGQIKYWTTVVVRDLVMLSSNKGNDAPRETMQRAPAKPTTHSPFGDDDDDLPF